MGGGESKVEIHNNYNIANSEVGDNFGHTSPTAKSGAKVTSTLDVDVPSSTLNPLPFKSIFSNAKKLASSAVKWVATTDWKDAATHMNGIIDKVKSSGLLQHQVTNLSLSDDNTVNLEDVTRVGSKLGQIIKIGSDYNSAAADVVAALPVNRYTGPTNATNAALVNSAFRHTQLGLAERNLAADPIKFVRTVAGDEGFKITPITRSTSPGGRTQATFTLDQLQRYAGNKAYRDTQNSGWYTVSIQGSVVDEPGLNPLDGTWYWRQPITIVSSEDTTDVPNVHEQTPSRAIEAVAVSASQSVSSIQAAMAKMNDALEDKDVRLLAVQTRVLKSKGMLTPAQYVSSKRTSYSIVHYRPLDTGFSVTDHGSVPSKPGDQGQLTGFPVADIAIMAKDMNAVSVSVEPIARLPYHLEVLPNPDPTYTSTVSLDVVISILHPDTVTITPSGLVPLIIFADDTGFRYRAAYGFAEDASQGVGAVREWKYDGVVTIDTSSLLPWMTPTDPAIRAAFSHFQPGQLVMGIVLATTTASDPLTAGCTVYCDVATREVTRIPSVMGITAASINGLALDDERCVFDFLGVMPTVYDNTSPTDVVRIFKSTVLPFADVLSGAAKTCSQSQVLLNIACAILEQNRVLQLKSGWTTQERLKSATRIIKALVLDMPNWMSSTSLMADVPKEFRIVVATAVFTYLKASTRTISMYDKPGLTDADFSPTMNQINVRALNLQKASNSIDYIENRFSRW